MLTASTESSRDGSTEPDRASETFAPDSNRGVVEAARLEFEALPNEVNSEARKTAFIHLIVSRGYWGRKAAKDAKPKS